MILNSLSRTRIISQSSSLNQLRYQTTKAFSDDSIYVISIPITTQKSYIYCNHGQGKLNTTQQRNFPLFIKLETKAITYASKGWNKLTTSKNSVNMKITKWIKKLLDTIPYEENCLRSFPSKSVMVREINQQTMKSLESNHSVVIQKQIEELSIPSSQIKPIPFFHPKFQNASTILTQLHKFRDSSYSSHFKHAIYCAVGIPIVLPLAILPVIPNVPGFYLAYRLYCNIKAIIGVKHLEYLLESSSSTSSSDVGNTQHLNFKEQEIIDTIYKQHIPSQDLIISEAGQEEKLIIDPSLIENLVNQLELKHLKEDLLKALRQESQRLKSNPAQ